MTSPLVKIRTSNSSHSACRGKRFTAEIINRDDSIELVVVTAWDCTAAYKILDRKFRRAKSVRIIQSH